MSDIRSYRDLIVWQKAIRSTLMEEFTRLTTQVGELAHGLLRSLEAREAASHES